MKNFVVKKVGAGLALLCLLAGCASGPKPADWQIESKAAIERALAAYFEGSSRSSRAEAAEVARARNQLARTGQPEQLANAELLLCASRVASLDFSSEGRCPAFEVLRLDATPAQRAYADYLVGRSLSAQETALLPPLQQTALRSSSLQPLQSANDPLALLVAAGVRLKSEEIPGRFGLTSSDLALASDTASSQGWRRPLLAWLGVEAKNARLAGNTALAERLQRRIVLAGSEASALQISTTPAVSNPAIPPKP